VRLATNMQRDLVTRLAPRLNELGKGGYARVYRKDARVYPTPTHLLVAELLDSLGVEYEELRRVPSVSDLVADFAFKDTFLFIEREIPKADLRKLSPSKKYVIVKTDSVRSDKADHGVRVIQLGSQDEGRLQTIFLDDPSFNFDYAHILPRTQKCSVMHGHTSSALVEIIGHPKDGMVVDFGAAKEIIRDAVRSLDHKLFINERYVKTESGTHVTLAFKTVHGDFRIEAPKGTTVLLDGEATVENLAREFISRIAPKMPDNVTAVGVYVYEGLNKGSHLLAQVHSRQGEKRRRTR
jgi:6-pyruvoyltetrahydropterin/6-carboxytetrahydropterin synthase